MGWPWKAAGSFVEAFKADPSSPLARSGAIDLLVEGSGRVGALEAVVHKWPTLVRPKVHLSFAHAADGRPAEAASQFRAALVIQPDDPQAWSGLTLDARRQPEPWSPTVPKVMNPNPGESGATRTLRGVPPVSQPSVLTHWPGHGRSHSLHRRLPGTTCRPRRPQDHRPHRRARVPGRSIHLDLGEPGKAGHRGR